MGLYQVCYPQSLNLSTPSHTKLLVISYLLIIIMAKMLFVLVSSIYIYLLVTENQVLSYFEQVLSFFGKILRSNLTYQYSKKKILTYSLERFRAYINILVLKSFKKKTHISNFSMIILIC